MVFEPINVNDLDPIGKKRALETLIFHTERSDGRIKGRTCASGSTQGEYIYRDKAASPTAITKSILIIGTVEIQGGVC